MKIITWTLSDNRERTIGRCMSSAAEFADVCLLIDTGITDKTIGAAREAAKDKLVVVAQPWPGRFDTARNGALEACNKLGGTWGFMLDSDEWVTPVEQGNRHQRRAAKGYSVARDFLEASRETVLLVRTEGGDHTRERAFRLPTPIRFVGRTHESITVVPRAELPGIAVGSPDKTPEEYRSKHLRDIELLKESLKEEPTSSRWWFYLGQAYHSLGDSPLLAIEGYKRCVDCNGWDEEAAWACYQIAVLWADRHEYDRALQSCALGLTKRPDFAELCWLAGWICWKTGAHRKAVEWSELALVHGRQQNKGVRKRNPFPNRLGFSYMAGLREGPYQVMRESLQALGDEVGAKAAAEMFALEMRK